MKISINVVGNILNSVHRKVADALLNGKALRIRPPEVVSAAVPSESPVSD